MQKKKSSFQAIPNYRVSSIKLGRIQRSPSGTRLQMITACALLRRLKAHRQVNPHRPAFADLYGIPAPLAKWCIAIGAVARNLDPIRRSCSLNIQAKYETLPAGRPDSLS